MKARSLRWRLAVSMILIIAAVVAAAGVFSTVRVRQELNEYMIAERRAVTSAALRDIHDARPETLRRAFERTQSPILIVDDAKNVIARYPPDIASFDVRFRADGTLALTRKRDGRSESLLFKVSGNRVEGVGFVYFLPPMQRRGPPEFRIRGDRWLLGGLAGAALLAVLVMLTIFRRVLGPVEVLTAGARALAGGRLDVRVPVRGNDEVAELGRAFNSMAEGLERNERARRNMVSDVAHELRTPLTNIRVNIEGAQDGLIPADARFLASIDEEAATLARLVDDLQQLSLAEAGQLRLELAEVSVAELVERAAALPLQPVILSRVDGEGPPADSTRLAPNQGILRRAAPAQDDRSPARYFPANVVRDIPPDLIVRADALRLTQVVRNLVVNALAHARSSVSITAARVGDAIEIRVADDGPGVPDEHVERIFDRFYRVDGSRSRATGGAGLGLAIARQLVELHGGRIWYERPAFVIALPA